ncbi:MAG TPA: YraN family protein [Candidatus Sumerlaeota bacterium]|nr:YraN family protein [Candidatus Sumerlaeota bacterium]
MLSWLKKLFGRMRSPSRGHLDHIRLGRLGEDFACDYLKSKNFAIIERNYRCSFGELDIIAREGDTIVFVEVKTQYSHVNIRAERKVDARKQKKLKRLAERYSREKLPLSSQRRIDVIIVYIKADNTLGHVVHYRRAI